MKLGGALFFIALTGLQLALAQDVTDCTVIATGLETTAIEPDTGKKTTVVYNTPLQGSFASYGTLHLLSICRFPTSTALMTCMTWKILVSLLL